MLIFGGQNTTQMTKLGSRDSMPVSKQSGSLIDKNITVPAGQWWTSIPKSSLPSHFLQWNLIWWGKKIWHINTSCFQWLKSINMTDTNIFHLNVSQFRWYQREWDWKQTENNGEWDTTTFKITLLLLPYQRAHSLCLASSFFLIQAKVLQMRIIVDGFF